MCTQDGEIQLKDRQSYQMKNRNNNVRERQQKDRQSFKMKDRNNNIREWQQRKIDWYRQRKISKV